MTMNPRWWRAVSLAALIVVTAGAASFAVHLRTPDNGVVGCGRVAAHLESTGAGDGWPVGLRSDFARSRYPELRTAGLSLFNYDNRIVTPKSYRVTLNKVADACRFYGVRVPRA